MFEVAKSNVVHKIGFDPTMPGVDRGYLVVQFANFDVVAYMDVAYFDALMLMNAESVGVAFHSIIKPKYKSIALSKRDSHVVNADDMSKPKPKEVDELPMLDVVGVDSHTGIGKVTSVRRKK